MSDGPAISASEADGNAGLYCMSCGTWRPITLEALDGDEPETVACYACGTKFGVGRLKPR